MSQTRFNASVEGRQIVISRIVDAPVSLVWRAFTEREHVAHWWGPFGFTNDIEHMDVRAGGEWRFTMRGPDGEEHPNVIAFHDVSKERRLAFSHGSRVGEEPLFEVEIAFEALDHGTRVTLRQTHPSEERAAQIATFAIDGGKQTMTRLQGYLEAMRERVSPAVIEGAVEATDAWDFVFLRAFDAPRALVWRAMTEAEHLAQWFGPPGMGVRVVANEAHSGGQFRYAMRAGPHEMCGRFVYREVSEPERLAYVVSFTDGDFVPVRHPMSATWPLEVLAIVTLTELDAKTLLVARSIAIHAEPVERETFRGGHKGMQQGTSGMYDALAKHVASIAP